MWIGHSSTPSHQCPLVPLHRQMLVRTGRCEADLLSVSQAAGGPALHFSLTVGHMADGAVQRLRLDRFFF